MKDGTSSRVAVIGLGRVGLPLALAFADCGLSVIGVDRDADRVEAVRAGRMPFAEPGADTVLARVLSAGCLTVTTSLRDCADANYIVVCVPTARTGGLEMDLSAVWGTFDDIAPGMRAGQTLILRSTVAPGTTDLIAARLAADHGKQVGDDVYVAHVPERIASGRFFAEVHTLPCIVGGVGERSTRSAGTLFAHLDAPIISTSPIEAELAKIWGNTFRYAMFALPNLLMMDCEQYGANVFSVIELINRDYSRGGMPPPGLTGGTCLRKDFAFVEARTTVPGMLAGAARVNEAVPAFLAAGLRRRLAGCQDIRVTVLGTAFKADVDDERDSLSLVLIDQLRTEGMVVRVHDPNVDTTSGWSEALEGAHAVVIGAAHQQFRRPDTLSRIVEAAHGEPLIVDPWNVLGSGQVFAFAGELGAEPDANIAASPVAGRTA